MPEPLVLTGRLTQKDQKKLFNAARGDAISPTTLYYAGVTAPVIGAGMASFGRSGLEDAGLVSTYWLTLLSAILAAMAGIVWYLIFMRWSKRQSDNILTHEDFDKEFTIDTTHISLKRRRVETRIHLSDIKDVIDKKGDIIILFSSAAPMLIPGHWFDGGTDQRSDVLERLKQWDSE